MSCSTTAYASWKIILILILAFDTCLAPVAIAVMALAMKHGCCNNERLKQRTMRRLSILFEAFNENASWWQSWILVRRTLFVAFDNTFLNDSPNKYMAYSFVILASVLANAYWRPYKVEVVNSMEMVSQTLLLILSIFLTSVTSTAAPYSVGVGAVVFLLIGLPTCVFLAFIVYFKVTAFRSRLANKGATASPASGGTAAAAAGGPSSPGMGIQLANALRVQVPSSSPANNGEDSPPSDGSPIPAARNNGYMRTPTHDHHLEEGGYPLPKAHAEPFLSGGSGGTGHGPAALPIAATALRSHDSNPSGGTSSPSPLPSVGVIRSPNEVLTPVAASLHATTSEEQLLRPSSSSTHGGGIASVSSVHLAHHSGTPSAQPSPLPTIRPLSAVAAGSGDQTLAAHPSRSGHRHSETEEGLPSYRRSS